MIFDESFKDFYQEVMFQDEQHFDEQVATIRKFLASLETQWTVASPAQLHVASLYMAALFPLLMHPPMSPDKHAECCELIRRLTGIVNTHLAIYVRGEINNA